MKFPPINLYSMPRTTWPPKYLELEKEYTKDILEQFYTEPEGTIHKEVLRRDIKEKREEFNRLWNSRAGG